MRRHPTRAALAVVASLTLAATLAAPFTSTAAAAAPAAAASSSIYDQPASFAGTHPGQVLQSHQVTIQQVGIPTPYQAWQIQYVSQNTDSTPQADVATVVKPFFSLNRQLLSYQPAIDSLRNLST